MMTLIWPLRPPIVARFGKGHETGCSGVQLIETSQISFHTNDTAICIRSYSVASPTRKQLFTVLETFFPVKYHK
jgi:hypothetical protein